MSETSQKPQATSKLKFVWDYFGWRDPDPAINDDVKGTAERFDEKTGECGDKENEKATSTPEEATIEDLVAIVWQLLDQLDRDNLPVSTPVPVAAAPPSYSDSTPESDTLLERNQAMLSSTPPSPRTVPDAAQPTPSAVPVVDCEPLGYVSSPEVMNGAQATPSSTETQTRSLWQVLGRLVPSKSPVVPAPDSKTDGEEGPEEEASETILMMRASLFPDANPNVELAESTVINVPDTDGEDQSFIPKVIANGFAASRWPGKLKRPWGEKKTEQPSDDPTSPPTEPAEEVEASILSKTEFSFEATWWGYRIRLPPPAIDFLAKNAPMIAAVFEWLTEKIPTANLPPPLKTPVALLKPAIPYLKYIGLCIALSWSEIKTSDKGNGVVVSAIWLLPIILIPESWEDWEKSILNWER